jgi:hypothetical protein
MIRLTPIVERLQPPTPDKVRAARERAGLTQTQAASLISTSEQKAYRTWQNYETPVSSSDHRPIPLSVWELFLLLTDQHPMLALRARARALPHAL